MKTKKIEFRQSLLLIILFVFTFQVSCISDNLIENEGSKDKEGLVRLKLRVPEANSGMTRAVDASVLNDNEVKSIEVLLFNENGYTYKPIYSTDIKTDENDPNLKSFEVSVPEGTFDMTVLANSKSFLENALGNFREGDSKVTVMSKLIASNKDVWDLSTTLIPMWGEAKNLVVDNSSSKNITLDMLRSVAKVGLILGENGAKEKLSLESVQVFNYNTNGLIAPLEANWDSDSKSVTDVSLPSQVAKETTNSLMFDGAAIQRSGDESDRGFSLAKDIYLFESEKGSSATHTENTCLVIGGKYGDDSAISYYRLDFATKEGNDVNYKHILRNHNYKIAVSKVSGRGYDTVEEALKNQAINIEANVIEWDNAEIGNVVFDGQYMLGASSTDFEFSREARTEDSFLNDNKLSLTTDFPGGWKVTSIVDNEGEKVEWLRLSKTEGPDKKTTSVFLIMDENISGKDQYAKITVNAGRMDMVITILHNNESNIGIKLVDISTQKNVELIEYPIKMEDLDKPVDISKLRVLWSPKTTDLYISGTSAPDRGFKFDKEAGDNYEISTSAILKASDYPDGFIDYNIRPMPILKSDLEGDPFYQRATTYTFSINDGVKSAVKSLILKQYVYNVDIVQDHLYLLDGKTKSFGVKANSPFTVEVVSDEKNAFTLKTFGGAPDISKEGSRIYFDTTDDINVEQPEILETEVKLVVKSKLGVFPDKEVSLRLVSGNIVGEANSYMIKPNDLGVFIPVSKVNRSEKGKLLGANQEYTAEVLWTTAKKGVGDEGSISMARAVGRGENGYVLVVPGKELGNSLVAIRDTNGKILWSWHIWVTDYDVSGAKPGDMMDRNLGALKAGIPNVKVLGDPCRDVATLDELYKHFGMSYQWGRKDPFVLYPIELAGRTKQTIDMRNLYSKDGESIKACEYNTTNRGLEFAIQNPTQVLAKITWYDGQDRNKWPQPGTIAKGNEDPCPEGWRVLGGEGTPAFDVYFGTTGNFWESVNVSDGAPSNNTWRYRKVDGKMMTLIAQGNLSARGGIGFCAVNTGGYESMWLSSDKDATPLYLNSYGGSSGQLYARKDGDLGDVRPLRCVKE